MEVTMVSIGRSVLSGALGFAKSNFAEEVALQLGVNRDKAFITDELEIMQSFLLTAHEERDEHSRVVRILVKQVRDLAYDVEDGLQDFFLHVHRKSWWRIPRTLLDRHHVARQMKELRAKVEDVGQRNLRYRLIDGSTSEASHLSITTVAPTFDVSKALRQITDQHQLRLTFSLAQLIIAQELFSNNQIRVIGIWGASGSIGHASIIWDAYYNPDVKLNFPCRAWVRLASPFHPKEFVQSIVRQFRATAEGLVDFPLELELDEAKTGQELADEYSRYVDEKRYLIVLTGLSTIEEWLQIKTCFLENKMGSRIVVSTEQAEVANLCAGQKSKVYKLEQLSDDHTIYAFYLEYFYMTLDCTKKVIQEDQPNTDVDGKNEIQEDQDELTHSNKMGCVPREFQLIGREKEKSDIIELIRELSSIRQFEVIAVWGMSGFGKTTLIKDVCQGQEVNDMFDKTAFVTVLQPFRLEGLLRSLALQLDASKGNIASMGVADLTRVLGRHIKGKSCLIVLDDLPSTTEWDTIMASLGAKGTSSLVIVITTRREDVAKHCCKKPECIRLLNGLEEKDALYLFTRKVFKNKKTDLAREYPKLVVPAKQILNKCIGHPLAIISIGSFLGSQPQKTVAEWRKVNELLSVQLEMYTLFHAIKLVLMKSYDGLPYYLKSCFLYLSIFLEDRNVSRRRLVYRWVAEGYSRDIAVADSYFMKLIERSMILPTQVSHCGVQGIDSCELHDLIREICIATSMEENLVLRLEEGCSLNMHSTVRHLAISSNWDGDETELENTVELSRIRSLTVFGKWRPFYISHKMRFLRVLDLEGVEGLADHHLEHIGKHLHLRYLSLRWCEGITYLPDSIGNLRHLETLDIKGTEIFKLPKTITKLSKLLNLKAGRPSLYPCELHKGAKLLCCIPSRMRFNWRHGACTPFARCIEGYNVGVKVPRGTRKLKALHTLRYVHLAWGNAIIKEIKCLTSLRKLGVVGINNTNGLEFCSAISSLCRLESLSVLAHDSLNGCLDGMCTAPENLQSLKLSGSLEKLPVWIKGLQNLVKLKLQFTTLSCNWAAMETLGYLPYLSILGLHEGESMMDVIRFQSGLFRKLTVLDLLYFSMEIKSVEFEEGSMPKLEVLTLFLEDTETAFFGLEHLRSIKEVRLGVQFNENSTKFSENMSLEEMEKAEEQSKEAEKKTKLVKDKLRKELQIQLHRDENRPILKVE